MAQKKDPNQLAADLLKLLQANAKPVLTRSGANKFKLVAKGKTIEFEVSSKPERRRKDL